MLIVHNQYPQQSELLRIQHRYAEYLAREGRSRYPVVVRGKLPKLLKLAKATSLQKLKVGC